MTISDIARNCKRMAILLAVTAIFCACSKEEPAVDDPIVESPASGIPFVVNVADNGATRGTAINVISHFNMVGIQGASNLWMDNFLFTKPEDRWVAVGHENLTWPDGTGTSTFYAVSDNSNSAPDIIDGKFSYTVPESFSDQKDLLVSLSENNESGTPVTLSFKHALSSVKFKIGYDKNQLDGDKDFHVIVPRITLYHIATKGVFDFANYATNPWTVDPEDAEYKDLVINLKQPAEFVPSPVADFLELDGNYLDESWIGEIYVMPHKPTAWDTDGTKGHPLNNSYIGVTCQFFEYTGKTYEDIIGMYFDLYDEDARDLAKDLYIDDYMGQLNTDNDDWLYDKGIRVIVPTSDEFKMNVVLKSCLDWINEEAYANGSYDNYEEVFIPLVMSNGFGLGKTNVINTRMDRMKHADGESFFTEND